MILLLDAHALLWSVSDLARLDRDAMTAIRDPRNDVLVSAASIWELEIKRQSGKLRYEVELIDGAERAGFDVIPVLGVDTVHAARLPLHHRDPFDRMLVAQARRLGATLVSRDTVFDAYSGVERLAA